MVQGWANYLDELRIDPRSRPAAAGRGLAFASCVV